MISVPSSFIILRTAKLNGMGKWICWYVSTIGRGVRICIKLYTNTSYCKYYIKNPYPRGFDSTITGWGGEHSLECQNSISLVTLRYKWIECLTTAMILSFQSGCLKSSPTASLQRKKKKKKKPSNLLTR